MVQMQSVNQDSGIWIGPGPTHARPALTRVLEEQQKDARIAVVRFTPGRLP